MVKLDRPRHHESMALPVGLRRAIARRHERGAALLIVVLVLMSLTGVAIYAAKAASTDVEVAGRYRQSHQTHEIANLAMQASLSELTRDPQTYLHAMMDSSSAIGSVSASPCENEVRGLYNPVANDFSGLPIDAGGCYPFTFDGIEKSTTTPLVARGDAGTEAPSGIGPSTIRPDFIVEMTDKTTWDVPVAGYGSGAGNNMKFYSVTLTGKGMILPRDTSLGDTSFGLTTATSITSMLGQGLGYRVSVEELRAQVMVGPLPEGL